MSKKLTHEQGVSFLTALITLIYNFVKSFRRNVNETTNTNHLSN